MQRRSSAREAEQSLGGPGIHLPKDSLGRRTSAASSSRPTMICILLPDLRGGGAERVSIDLARAFSRLGHQVEFALLSATGDFLPEVRQSFSVFDLGVTRFRHALGRFSRYLRVRRPDAVIAMMWPLTAIAPIAAKTSNYHGRVLVCEHGMLSGQYASWGLLHRIMLRASTMIAYRFAGVCVGVSRAVAADMANLASLDVARVVALHNSVRPLTTPDLNAMQEAEALWCTSGPRILSVGNFSEVKNHPMLLRAFADLRRKEAHLMLLGQGPDEPRLRALAAALNIQDRVIFAGFHTDPAPYYATADLFVLSSNREGLPTVLVEALSMGLPVVSTDCQSGPAEILENGRWGRLVPVGDRKALTAAIDAALSDTVDRDALKRRSGDFAPEIAARKYLDLLDL